jgi:hypothetical protein
MFFGISQSPREPRVSVPERPNFGPDQPELPCGSFRYFLTYIYYYVNIGGELLVGWRTMQKRERRTLRTLSPGSRGRSAIFAGKPSPTGRVSGEMLLAFSKWPRPLLTESAPQLELDLTHRKQTTEKFLTEARTHISDFSFCSFPGPFPAANAGTTTLTAPIVLT